MKFKLFVFTAIILITGAFSNCTNRVDYLKEEEKIKELWYKISEYGANGDWENYAYYFDQTEKLQIIHPGMGEWLNGWDEFSGRYKAMMESGVAYTIVKNDIQINVSKSGDMAWGLADVIFSFDSNPDNKIHMWESIVFEKIADEWKLVMCMASSVADKKDG